MAGTVANQQDGPDVSLPATGDESSEQYTFYKVDANGRADQATANDGTDVVIGVLQNKPAAQDREASIRIYGTSKVVTGGSVNEAATVRPDASGRAVATTTDGHIFGGIALTASSGAGEIIEVLVTPGNYRGA